MFCLLSFIILFTFDRKYYHIIIIIYFYYYFNYFDYYFIPPPLQGVVDALLVDVGQLGKFHSII